MEYVYSQNHGSNEGEEHTTVNNLAFIMQILKPLQHVPRNLSSEEDSQLWIRHRLYKICNRNTESIYNKAFVAPNEALEGKVFKMVQHSRIATVLWISYLNSTKYLIFFHVTLAELSRRMCRQDLERHKSIFSEIKQVMISPQKIQLLASHITHLRSLANQVVENLPHPSFFVTTKRAS